VLDGLYLKYKGLDLDCNRMKQEARYDTYLVPLRTRSHKVTTMSLTENDCKINSWEQSSGSFSSLSG